VQEGAVVEEGEAGAYGEDGNAAACGDRNFLAVFGGENVAGGGAEVQLGGAREADAFEGVAEEQGVGLLGWALRGERLDYFVVGGVLGGEVEVGRFGEL
jgi:hypothetical protein